MGVPLMGAAAVVLDVKLCHFMSDGELGLLLAACPHLPRTGCQPQLQALKCGRMDWCGSTSGLCTSGC